MVAVASAAKRLSGTRATNALLSCRLPPWHSTRTPPTLHAGYTIAVALIATGSGRYLRGDQRVHERAAERMGSGQLMAWAQRARSRGLAIGPADGR